MMKGRISAGLLACLSLVGCAAGPAGVLFDHTIVVDTVKAVNQGTDAAPDFAYRHL